MHATTGAGSSGNVGERTPSWRPQTACRARPARLASIQSGYQLEVGGEHQRTRNVYDAAVEAAGRFEVPVGRSVGDLRLATYVDVAGGMS
jgi:hypothetical protein